MNVTVNVGMFIMILVNVIMNIHIFNIFLVKLTVNTQVIIMILVNVTVNIETLVKGSKFWKSARLLRTAELQCSTEVAA